MNTYRTTLKIKRRATKKSKKKSKFPFTLKPKHRLKTTNEGKLYILLTVGVGLAAINTGNNMLFLVLGFMLSLIIISGIISEFNLRKIEVERRMPPLPWAGQICAIEIAVKNKKIIPSFCIEVQDIASNFTIDRRCFFLKVGEKKTQSTAYHCVFPRRGIYRFTGLIVMTKFPFGFFSKSFRVETKEDFIVAPHKVQVEPEIIEPLNSGEASPASKPDRIDTEVANLRPYIPGDDLRRVNWKISAHLGRTVIMEGIERNRKFVNIIFDDRLSSSTFALKWEKGKNLSGGGRDDKSDESLLLSIFEYQIDLAASTVDVLAKEGYTIWFATRRKTLGYIIPQQVSIILTELATITPLKSWEAKGLHLPRPEGGATLYFNSYRKSTGDIKEPGFPLSPVINV